MRRLRGLSLFWQVFLIDVALFVVATVVLALAPVTISAPLRAHELVVLLVGLATMVVVTLFALRRTLEPLGALAQTMARVDPLAPGQRVHVDESDADVRVLARAFNEMLDRLEAERRESGRRLLMGQESERRRIARELHDEVGQTLTGVLLQIESLSHDVPAHLRGEIDELRETARSGAEELRRIARRLRPEALEELGLQSALVALSRRISEQAGLRMERDIELDLPALSPEEELVIYRVAQEALTNIARHAEASHARLALTHNGSGVLLRVGDDGRGFDAAAAQASHGVRGMRERAILIDARLQVASAPGRGTEIELHIPRRAS